MIPRINKKNKKTHLVTASAAKAHFGVPGSIWEYTPRRKRIQKHTKNIFKSIKLLHKSKNRKKRKSVVVCKVPQSAATWAKPTWITIASHTQHKGRTSRYKAHREYVHIQSDIADYKFVLDRHGSLIKQEQPSDEMIYITKKLPQLKHDDKLIIYNTNTYIVTGAAIGPSYAANHDATIEAADAQSLATSL